MFWKKYGKMESKKILVAKTVLGNISPLRESTLTFIIRNQKHEN